MKPFVAAFGLFGFFSGVVLYLFLFWIVLRRKQKGKLEKALVFLLGSLLVWYAGNFVSLLLRQMDLAKVAAGLGFVDAVSFSGLALLPALLLHTHWLYYRRQRLPEKWERRTISAALLVLYIPLGFLPAALARLFPASAADPIQQLGIFTAPFLGLLAVAYYGSALVSIQILRKSDNRIEKDLFRKLLLFYLLVPLYNFYVFSWGGGEGGAGADLLTLGAYLSSVPPTFLVAYYIYRYRFLEIVVHRGIPTLLLILATLSFYLVGVRRLVLYLQNELAAPPLLVEGVFLAAVLLLFPPLGRWLESHIGRLFSGEFRKYRQLADTVNRAAASRLDSRLLAEFIEDILRRELGASRAKIHLGEADGVAAGETVFRLAASDGRTLGFLELQLPEAEFSTARSEALRLVSNEISFGLERSQLIESKLAMERELSRKSHMEELGRMAASVAHSVKNPLSSIKTLMQLLREASNLDEEQKREVTMMIGEIDRLSQTVSGLLKFSRLEDPQKDPEAALSEVHLRTLLDSVQTVMTGDLRARGLQLETQLPEAPATVLSDPEALTDILSNLLSNAIEASPPGGKIRVSVQNDDSGMEIAVQDWGTGVPAAVRDRLFDPFVTTRARGTGLGLAIVRKRALQLGGEVSFLSPAPDGGTRFTVALARQPAAGRLQEQA